MIRIRRSHHLPIGLDIGFDSVKLLQLEVGDDQHLSVLAAARLPLPEEARQDSVLRTASVSRICGGHAPRKAWRSSTLSRCAPKLTRLDG